MSPELLFEIGTEELPWGAIESGREQMAERAAELLAASRLAFEGMEIFTTPRRLALYLKELAPAQGEVEQEFRGPAAGAAFDAEGKPTQAAEGFARSKGVDVGSLQVRETPKGSFVYAIVKDAGRPAVELLPGLLAELARSLNFKKSMRWGSGELRFARPIRWLAALYGAETIEIELDGLRAGNTTFGHRLSGSDPLTIDEPGRYAEILRQARVIAAEDERRRVIVDGIEALTAKRGLRALAEKAIIDEVTDLTEDPHVIMGSFPDRYRQLPREVLVTAMEEHQRYIPVETATGELEPAFLVVHNGNPAAEEIIRAGNERVLRARLDDALFFYTDDTREPLEAKVEKLKHVVFQADMGTLYDKALRLQELCRSISAQANLASEVAERAVRAALLCKADLVTDMVIEFTSLQGVMGRIYADVSGEPPAVGEAIEEHYLPRFAGDALPETGAGSVLALAEKLDNLAGAFGAGLIPSGSEDPYALRRQCGAIFSIIWENRFRTDLEQLLRVALAGYTSTTGRSFPDAVLDELADFCRQRLRLSFGNEGFRYDLIAAVLPGGLRDPADARARLEALSAAAEDGRLGRVYTAFERCHNLSKTVEAGEVNPALFAEEAEKALHGELERLRGPLSERLESEEYSAAFDIFIELAPTVDQLFEQVFIMGEDLEQRRNRLLLLHDCASLFQGLADFREIVPQA